MSSCSEKDRLMDALDTRHPDASVLRAHAASCAECGPELAALEGAFELLAALPDPQPRPEVMARIAAAVEADAAHSAAPIAARPSTRPAYGPTLALGLFGMALLRGATLFYGVRTDIRFLPLVERLAAPIALGVLYIVGMSVLFLWRRPWGAFLVLGAAAAVAVGATEPGFHVHDVFVNSGCLPAGLTVGLAPLACAFFLGRGRIDGGAIAGAVAGMASGLLAMAVLHLHCPIGNFSHGLVGHSGVVLLLAVAGGALGRRIFVPRPAIA